MFKYAKPLFFICETPLHAGSGSDVGVVDLPIQRERHTDFPKIESSSLKGAIREAFEEFVELNEEETEYLLRKAEDAPSIQRLQTVFKRDKLVKAWQNEELKRKNITGTEFQHAIELAFGPDKGNLHAGALAFTDARLLLFPVKSMQGVFAWITCPKALQQFAKDLKLCRQNSKAGNGISFDWSVPEAPAAPNGCRLFVKEQQIILEEYLFKIEAEPDEQGPCTKLAGWLAQHLFPAAPSSGSDPYRYWRDKIAKDLVVLKDEDFRDFVTLSTEVITRTKINNETGTVQSGALFTEEYLPAESVLYALALASPIFKDRGDTNGKGIFRQRNIAEDRLVMDFCCNGLPDVLQVGGSATLGKGIVRTNAGRVE